MKPTMTIKYKQELRDNEYYRVYSPHGYEVLTNGTVYNKQRMFSALMEHLVWGKELMGFSNYIQIANKYTSVKEIDTRLTEIELFIKNNALHLNSTKYKTEEDRYTRVRRLFSNTFKEYKNLYYVLYGIKIDIKELTKYFKHITT